MKSHRCPSGYLVGWSFIVFGLLWYWNFSLLSSVPAVADAVDEVIGSRGKIPVLSHWALEYGDDYLGSKLLVIGLFLMLAMWSWLWLRCGSGTVVLASCMGIFILLVHGLIIGYALTIPLWFTEREMSQMWMLTED